MKIPSRKSNRRAKLIEVEDERTADAGKPIDLLDLATVYREHYAFIWRSLYHQGLSRSAVDDALQDVFLVVHRRLCTFDGRTSLRNWLFGIARRVASEYRRGHRRGTRRLYVVPAAAQEQPVRGGYRHLDTHELVEQLLESLDDDKREVFVLSELEGMTAPEIAEVLGLNCNTVYARLRAARQKVEAAAQRHIVRTRRELA